MTGGNRGLGLEVARQLAARNWTVILGCRDVDAARPIAATIPRATVRRVDLGDAATIVATVLEPRATGGWFRDGAVISW